MGPNYPNLFVGFVEKQIFEQYTDPITDYPGRYIDDCLDTASCSRVELERFINFVNNFHPALQFAWEISETSVSFLDILLYQSMVTNYLLLCSTSPLTPIAIFYFPLPTPTTPKGRFPFLNSFVFAASAAIFRPKVWR
jgi:hypothetical protein